MGIDLDFLDIFEEFNEETENNVEIIENGIYTTDDKIIIVEKILYDKVIVIYIPRWLTITSNKDISLFVNNMKDNIKTTYREYFIKESFLKFIKNEETGYLGKIKRN